MYREEIAVVLQRGWQAPSLSLQPAAYVHQHKLWDPARELDEGTGLFNHMAHEGGHIRITVMVISWFEFPTDRGEGANDGNYSPCFKHRLSPEVTSPW